MHQKPLGQNFGKMATVVWNILDVPQSLHRINRATREPYENPVDSVGNKIK